MSFVYVTEHGTVLGIDGGNMVIKNVEGIEETVPKETIEGISFFAKAGMTTDCVRFCLERGINISYFNSYGKYYGKMVPNISCNVTRLKNQLRLTETHDFSLGLDRKLINAKINNQLVVAKRYHGSFEGEHENEFFHLRNSRRKSLSADSKNVLMGYEGIASRSYFDILSSVIEPQFRFSSRMQRPAKEPFNAMLNMGYSLLAKEVQGELENRGLNAFAGFLHEDRRGHAALASDMMEEWRPVIVDSTVMSLIQGHEIHYDMFSMDGKECRMGSDAVKILLAALEKKMYTESRYLSYIAKPVTFRQAIWHQSEKLAKAIDTGDYTIYEPIMIR